MGCREYGPKEAEARFGYSTEESVRGENLRVVAVSRVEGAERVDLESVADLRPGDRFLMTVEGVYS